MLHCILLSAKAPTQRQLTLGIVFTKDSIKDTKDASMAGARISQDKNNKTSTQDASSKRVHQVKSLKTMNVKGFVEPLKTKITLLWFFQVYYDKFHHAAFPEETYS